MNKPNKTIRVCSSSFMRWNSIQRMLSVAWGLSLTIQIFAITNCVAGTGLLAATGVAVVTNESVASINVTDGGSGYAVPPTVTLSGGGGAGATAMAQVSGGEVTNIIVQSAGNGYTNAPVVAIDPPPAEVTPTGLSISMVPRLGLTGQAWH